MTCHYGERFFAVACLLVGLGAHAAGLREIAVPADTSGPQIAATLWTPCDRAARPVKVDSGGVALTIDGVKDCAVAREHLPLILISHGMFGDRYSHYDTAAYLADAGFAVLSVSHPLDFVSASRESVDNLSSFIARPNDIKRAISFLLSDAQTFVSIDPQRIGFFGFSRGGYTGLVLAGGAPNFRAPAFPCPEEFVMCQQIRDNAIPVHPPGDDPRIKAFVIADPVSFFPDQASLRSANRSIQLWSSELGGMGVRPEEVTAVKTNLPHAPEFHRADGAGHLSFQFPCTDEVTKLMSFVCTDPPGFNRKSFHTTLNAQLLDFFRRQLLDSAAAAARASSG